jgi:hypothetical protein
MNDIHRVRPAQLDEVFLQINIFAREDGDVHRVGNLLQEVGALPRDHVFQPRHIVLRERLA